MPIQGSIAEAGLPDVLQLLALGRKTGCLSMVDGQTHGEIYLDGGRISFASVANRLDRLGEVLVKSGRLTKEQLAVATEAQARGSKQQIGKILVDAGHIEQAELERWVRLQVEESVYFLFTWKQGTFTFSADRRPPHEPLPVPLEAEGLLLEGARRVDEWSQIEKKIPSFDLVYLRHKDKVGMVPADELTYPQQRILPMLDGTRDVNGLIDATGLSEFDVGKALYGLVSAGLAQLVERRSHIRHLEYRELLAYVVREAEFADPQRRKEAGRHIVDCPTCANRLRTIQVRRTEGSGTFLPATLELEPIAEASGARPQLQPSRPAMRQAGVEALRGPERRAGDRRTGRDRRQLERRSGPDRRRTVSVAWAEMHEERRMGPRRAGDRAGRLRGRRSGDAERRGVAAGQIGRAAGPGQRLTEARQLGPFAHRGGAEPSIRIARTFEEEEDVRAPSAASAEEGPPAVAEAAAPAAEQRAIPAGPAPDTRPKSAPITGPAGLPSTDLEWLISPEESVEMIRASRATTAARRAEARSSTAAPASAPRAEGVRVPEAAERGSPAVPRTAAARPAARAGSPEPLRAGLDDLWRRSDGIRRLAVGAGIAAVVLVAYLAGQLGGRGRAGQTLETAARGAPAASAEAPAPPPSRARTAEPRTPSQTQPVQSAARATPPPSRSGGRPAAVVPAPRPAQPAAQRATPSPVAVTQSAAPQAPPAIAQPTPAPAAAQPTPAKAEAPPPAAPRTADVTPVRAVSATEPDRDLAAGGWTPVDRAGASTTLGGTLGAIEGLTIESLSQSTAGARTRVRVAQLTESGERILLTETRAGAAVRGAGPAVVTALRVMPPSEAYPFSTGTVSLGNILITVKSSLAAETLRSLLAKLGDVTPGR